MKRLKIIMILVAGMSGSAFGQTAAPQTPKTPVDVEMAKLDRIVVKSFSVIAGEDNQPTKIFSLRVSLSDSGRQVRIESSRYTPLKIIEKLTDKTLYKDINWEALLSRKIRNREEIIIPVAFYQEDAKMPVVHNSIDDMFNFGEPGKGAPVLDNVTLLKPVVVWIFPTVR